MNIDKDSGLYKLATKGYREPPQDGCEFLLRVFSMIFILYILAPMMFLAVVMAAGAWMAQLFHPELLDGVTDNPWPYILLGCYGSVILGVPYLLVWVAFKYMSAFCSKIVLPDEQHS